jgi:hypothetical protein
VGSNPGTPNTGTPTSTNTHFWRSLMMLAEADRKHGGTVKLTLIMIYFAKANTT